MSRHVIAVEGKPSILPGIWLAPGSLILGNTGGVVVVSSFDYANIVGKAIDLQRNEATREVSVDITFHPDYVHLDDETLYDYSFYATDLIEETVEATEDGPGHRLITNAIIKAVSTVPNATYPRTSNTAYNEDPSPI